MKNNNLMVLLLFCINILNAQITFQKAFGGLASDNGKYVVQTLDNEYIIAGTTTSFGEGGRDVYVLKTNSEGALLWTKTFGGATDNEYGFYVQQTSDAGYIISGVASSFDDVAGDMYLIKLNADGDLMWSGTYGGIGYEWGAAIKQTADGGYIVTGQTPAFGAGGFEAYLVKLDALGTIEWTKTYGGSGLETASDVEQTADGGYIIIGAIDTYGAGSGDILLIKTDASGNLTWAKAIGTEDNEEALEVKQTPDGGYIVAGSGYGFQSLSRDMFLLKTDALGDITWAKTYGSTVNDQCESAILTNDGGYMLCGYSYGFSANENYQAYVVKTDASGNTAWSKTYGGTSVYGDYAMCIQQTNDNGYIITGETYSYGEGFFNVYLIKTDASGNSGCNQENVNSITSNKVFQTMNPPLITGTGGIAANPATVVHTGGTQTDLCENLSTGEELFNNKGIFIYPNPFKDRLYIENASNDTLTHIVLIDVLGRSVFESKEVTESIDVSNLTSGVYFMHITTERGTITQKLIKE